MTRVEVVVPTLRQVDARRGLALDAGTRTSSSSLNSPAVRERDSREQRPPLQIKEEEEEEDAKMCFLLKVSISFALIAAYSFTAYGTAVFFFSRLGSKWKSNPKKSSRKTSSEIG